MGKKKDNSTGDDDDRDYMGKVTQGDIGSMKGKDWFDAAGDFSGMLPLAGGDLVAAPLKAVSGAMGGKEDYVKYSEKLGKNLSAEATGDNRALKRSIKEMDGRAEANFEKFGAVGAGAMAGQAIGSAIMPVVGTMGGAWIGSSIASSLYDEAVKTQDQDAVGLVANLHAMQQRREQISPELVFAALAANLPDKTEARLEKRLEQMTGTKKYADAVAEGKTGALTRLMAEFDTDIRADTNMPVDMNNPAKTAAQQYAELINNGQMDARALLFRSDMPSVIHMVAEQQKMQQQTVTAQKTPRTAMHNPEIAGIAADLNQLGVTPTIGEDGKLVLLPNNNKLTPGKA